jgi:ribosomal protein L37E
VLAPGVVIANGYCMPLERGEAEDGDLVATDEALEVQFAFKVGFRKTAYERATLVSWAQVRRYELSGSEGTTQILRSRNARSVVRTEESSVLVLHTTDDQVVVRSPLAPSEMRQILGRNLAAIDQRSARAATRLTSSTSFADELTKLAQLHASGALSDGEFSAAKARLRAGWGEEGTDDAQHVRCRWCYAQNLSSASKCDACGAPLEGRGRSPQSKQLRSVATEVDVHPAPPAAPSASRTGTLGQPKRRRPFLRALVVFLVAVDALFTAAAFAGNVAAGITWVVVFVLPPTLIALAVHRRHKRRGVTVSP